MPSSCFQALQHLDQASPQFADYLWNILHKQDFDQHIASLQTPDLTEVIDYLDKALDAMDPKTAAFRQILRKLQSICTSRKRIPTSHVLPLSRLNINKNHIASGGFSDVFQGTYDDLGVCVKRLRVSSTGSPGNVAMMLYQEAVIWKRLKHINVVPFTGVTFKPLQIVSEWMPGGDLTAYIKSNPHVSRVDLLTDVAEGLNYLHQCEVVHGDLKGPNIMVDAHSRARITDFGLARDQGASEETHTTGGTARWTAPEILEGNGTSSKEADVFGFAMVMVEAFTGTAPFDLHLSITVAIAIMRGERPLRPTNPALTNGLWALMQYCWSQDPFSRPDMPQVLRVLHSPESSRPTTRGHGPVPHQRTTSTPTRPKPTLRNDSGSLRRQRKGGGRTISLVSAYNPPLRRRETGDRRRSTLGDGGASRRDPGGRGSHLEQAGGTSRRQSRPDSDRTLLDHPNQREKHSGPSSPRMNVGHVGKPERGSQYPPEYPPGDATDYQEKKAWWSAGSVVC